MPDSLPGTRNRGERLQGFGGEPRHHQDLIVRGTPALVLRRTYLSGDRAVRQFGVGAAHNGERHLYGDGSRFQWAWLILANGSRVEFVRTSPGTSFFNAMYEHRSAGEWQGARLGWTGMNWALRRGDGSLLLFQPCGKGLPKACSIIQERDADGHVIHYRRDRSGRLLRMEAEDRWIAFDYDAENRVARAHDSRGSEVRYEYDGRGRLARVESAGGTVRRYTYTDRDELAGIVEPGMDIKNRYDADGRCIRQVSRFDGKPDPFRFDLAYRARDGAVVQTEAMESDGTWTRYTWNESRRVVSETWGRDMLELAAFTYERDPATDGMTSLTLTCPDRTGRPLRHSSLVRGNEEWIKWDLLETHCSWSRRPSS